MRHFWADIRFGVRMLVRYPTLSIMSILTFGLLTGLIATRRIGRLDPVAALKTE